MGGEADLTEGLISEEHVKNKSGFGNSRLRVLPSWRGGDRAQSSPDWCRCPFASGLAASAPSAPCHYLEKKKRFKHKLVSVLGFWGRSLVLSLQDLTSNCFEEKLKN